MKHMGFSLIALTVLALLGCGSEDSQGDASTTLEDAPSTAIFAYQAKDHIGSSKTVCGPVVTPTYDSSSSGQPTLLNLDRRFPNEVFTVVIWGRNRSNFDQAPESFYRDQRICVTGLIESFEGIPRIEASSPGQIQIVR